MIIIKYKKQKIMTDINTFIPSFGDFINYCVESNIEKDLFQEKKREQRKIF